MSLGYIYDLPIGRRFKVGLGALGSIYGIPETLNRYYGNNPISFMIFARAKIE